MAHGEDDDHDPHECADCRAIEALGNELLEVTNEAVGMDNELKVYALVAVIGTLAYTTGEHRLLTAAIARSANVLENLQIGNTTHAAPEGMQ